MSRIESTYRFRLVLTESPWDGSIDEEKLENQLNRLTKMLRTECNLPSRASLPPLFDAVGQVEVLRYTRAAFAQGHPGQYDTVDVVVSGELNKAFRYEQCEANRPGSFFIQDSWLNKL